MSLAAVVYLSDAGSQRWALSRLAGRSVVLRLILTAARAGVREIGLPRTLAEDALRSQPRRYRRLPLSVFSLEDRGCDSGPLLLLPAHGVVDAASLRKLRESGEHGVEVALEESKGSPAPILVMAGEHARPLRERLIAGAPVGEELESHVRSGRPRLVAGGGYFVPVTDAESRREAEAALYRSLGTESDSLVDRLVNRRFSRFLTRLLVRLPVTPNTVTLLSLGFGLAAASQFWFATPASALLGLLFFTLQTITDHSDGDIARLTFQESTFGRWFDLSVDTLIHALLVLGMAATASAVGGPPMLLAGAVAAVGTILSAVVANLLLPRIERPRPFGRVLARLGNRDPFYLLLLCFILLRWQAEWALPYLVGLLAVGSHAYWLSCLLQRKRTAAHCRAQNAEATAP